MDKPFEFEHPKPNTPHPAEGADGAPWIDSGTIYVPINMNIPGAAVETGIFVPPGFTSTMGAINLIIYFHGNKDPAKTHLRQPIRTIWNHPAYSFRKLLEASGANYVLVAPTLADTGGPSQGDFANKNGAIGFVNAVVDALTKYGPCGANSTVAQLVLAAHSGGGYYLSKALPFLDGEFGVDECWAFDCLYGDGLPICAPDPYRICETANDKWLKITHTHQDNASISGWRSQIHGTTEDTLAQWASKQKPLRVFWNRGSGTLIRTANLALIAKLNQLPNVTVKPDLYTGFGSDARPVKPPVVTAEHDPMPKLKMPECLEKL